MFKKALILLLTLGLLFPALPVAAGPIQVTGRADSTGADAEMISEEKAIDIFRTAFPLQTKGVELECEYDDWSTNGNSSWAIRLRGYDGGSEYRNSNRGLYLGGTVDAITGEVTALTYRPSVDYYRERSLTLNRSQALPLAEDFLKKLHPDKISRLKLVDKINSFPNNGFENCYTFRWERMSEGVPVDWDSITIGINAYSGIVCKYDYTWHDLKLGNVKNVMSPEQVLDKILQENGLYLSYTRTNKAGTGLSLTPVYKLNTTACYVDALTGNLLDSHGNPLKEKGLLYEKSFSPVSLDNTVNEKSLTSKAPINEVMQTAQKFFADMGFTGKIHKSGSGGGGYGCLNREYWCLSPEDNDSELGNYSVSIDIYTGEFVGFGYHSRYIQPSPDGEKMSREKALAKAQACIKKYNPEYAESVVVNNSIMEYHGTSNEPYYFQFARIVNGLPLDRDSINIEVDPFTGKILNYQVEYYPVQYGPSTGLISKDRAADIFKNNVSLQLSWSQQRDEDYQPAGKPMLVYMLPYQELNALSGEITERWYDKNQPVIDGKNISPELSLLYDNGLIPKENVTNPQQPITRQQALIALTTASLSTYYSSDLDDFELNLEDIEVDDKNMRLFKYAATKKVIPCQGRFNPQKPVSREELAVWSVKLLGLDIIGHMKNEIAVPFKDAAQINPGNQNYVGLAYGLELIKPVDNNIAPSQPVNWNDLAACASHIAVMPVNN